MNPETEEEYFVCYVQGLQQDAYDFVTGGDPSIIYAVIEPAGNDPIEPTTEEPTTEEPTTEEPTTEEPTTVPPAPPEDIIGDVNMDGVVTISDATAIQRYSVGLDPQCDFNNKLADVNNDGVITIRDATCVQRFAAEMTKKLGNAGKNYEDIDPASDDPQIVG